MIDFPASPSVGQLFSSGGFSWRWDGIRWVSAGAVPTVANPNKFINPFVEIDQQNEGAIVHPSNAAPFVCDGFRATVSGCTGFAANANRAASGPLGYPYYLGWQQTAGATSVAAGDYARITQNMEGYEIEDARFGTVNALPLTLSFYAYSSIANTYCVNISNAAGSRSFLVPFTCPAGSWQLFATTIPGDTAGTWPSGNAGALTVGWTLATGTTYQGPTGSWQASNLLGQAGFSNAFIQSATALFGLGPCKLELGSAATPMARSSFRAELAKCQRYYEKSYPPGTALGTVVTNANSQGVCAYFMAGASYDGYVVPFKVTKRAVPTVTPYAYNGTAGNLSKSAGGAFSAVAANVLGISANAHGYYFGDGTAIAIGWDFVADARL